MSYFTTTSSPLGELLLVGEGDALGGLYLQEGRRPQGVSPHWARAEEPFAEAIEQLEQYFEGSRREFELALCPTGSAFQRRVWAALREIPYGGTASYGEIARRVGAPSAPRAVGVANAQNPLCIVVPCHRVIGADGSLTGYAGGTERKRLLLELEAAGSAAERGALL